PLHVMLICCATYFLIVGVTSGWTKQAQKGNDLVTSRHTKSAPSLLACFLLK
ncbi:hypothetical protein BgiMline_023468, partial [Biomphalaria glabrata]